MLQWWRVHVLLAGLGTLTSCAAVKVVGCIGDSITDGVGASVSGLPFLEGNGIWRIRGEGNALQSNATLSPGH